MHSLDDIEISLRVSFEKAGIIYHAKISVLNLKGKEHKNTNELCLKVFEKLHILTQTAWKSDTYFEDNAILSYQNGSQWRPPFWNKH